MQRAVYHDTGAELFIPGRAGGPKNVPTHDLSDLRVRWRAVVSSASARRALMC